MRRVTLTAYAFACSLGTLPAQVAPQAWTKHSLYVDSKWIDNRASRERVVFQYVVRFRSSSWLRLFFDQTNLPIGSYLRLTSLRDNDVQILDGRGIIDYGYASCYLNGEAIRVELVAGPNSLANRVLIVAVTAGIALAETICGPNDNRKQSTDKRQGRFAGICSGWLFGNDAIGTAGHCGNTSSVMIVEFNVPNSTSSGNLVRSKAVDQYPTVLGTAKMLAGSIGADWLVARLGKNSQSGKLPGEVQGAWYGLGSVPNAPSGQNIRVTGYGTSAVRVLNQVQKTHVGPLNSIQGTYLRYRTDTTGGNSGSPVIHENTGLVIGVHTHGGCTSTGGANHGTRIDRADFQSAIKGLIGVAGKITYYGKACKGSTGTPVLRVIGTPNIKNLIRVQTSNLPRNAQGLQFIGLHQMNIDLSGIGLAGCTQLISLDLILALPTDSLGFAVLVATIPNDTGLIGRHVFFQHAASDKTNGSTVVSNAANLAIGYQ